MKSLIELFFVSMIMAVGNVAIVGWIIAEDEASIKGIIALFAIFMLYRVVKPYMQES